MVLDFRMVESIDATAVKKLKKLLRYTDRVGLTICFTNLTTKMVEMFEEEGVHELRVEADPHGHGGHGHGHGHEVESGVESLKIFDDADAAVEWACDQLLHTKKQFNMMLPDPNTGKFTAKIIFRNVLNYIKLGFAALVQGEEFDSATFRECVAGHIQPYPLCTRILFDSMGLNSVDRTLTVEVTLGMGFLLVCIVGTEKPFGINPAKSSSTKEPPPTSCCS